MDNKEYDLIIIGGGPAGLTCGIYACRYGLKTLIIEKYAIGGQVSITNEINNYPGFETINGFDLTSKIVNQYKINNGKIVFANIKKLDLNNKVVETDAVTYFTKSIVLCMGATERKLNIENEEEMIGKGMSYCAICDGPLYKDKNVVVFGTGNSAVENAIYLSSLAKKVTLVSKYPNLKAQNTIIEELNSLNNKNKNIEIIYDYLPTKIIGKTNVESVEIKHNINGNLINIKCDGIFASIGRKPDNALIKDQMQLTDYGYVISDENLTTNIEGVFVAGDLRQKLLRQIVTACADGAVAATQVYKFILSKKNN